jgi:FAD/FMN-containing dehydrogenase
VRRLDGHLGLAIVRPRDDAPRSADRRARGGAAQFDGAAAICKETGATAIRDLPDELVDQTWAEVAELAGGAAYDPQTYVVAKLVAPPAQTFALAAAVRTSWPEAEITAHPYAGAVFASVPLASASADPAMLWQACVANQWTAEYLSAPAMRREEFIAPLPAHTPMKLQRRLKAALDPSGIFDPGGFLGGI